jgi:hypothetical protein
MGGGLAAPAPIRGSSCIGGAMRDNIYLKQAIYFSPDTLYDLSMVYACVFCFHSETVKSTLRRFNIIM